MNTIITVVNSGINSNSLQSFYCYNVTPKTNLSDTLLQSDRPAGPFPLLAFVSLAHSPAGGRFRVDGVAPGRLGNLSFSFSLRKHFLIKL